MNLIWSKLQRQAGYLWVKRPAFVLDYKTFKRLSLGIMAIMFELCVFVHTLTHSHSFGWSYVIIHLWTFMNLYQSPSCLTGNLCIKGPCFIISLFSFREICWKIFPEVSLIKTPWQKKSPYRPFNIQILAFVNVAWLQFKCIFNSASLHSNLNCNYAFCLLPYV